jgi:hypothetical protein
MLDNRKDSASSLCLAKANVLYGFDFAHGRSLQRADGVKIVEPEEVLRKIVKLDKESFAGNCTNDKKAEKIAKADSRLMRHDAALLVKSSIKRSVCVERNAIMKRVQQRNMIKQRRLRIAGWFGCLAVATKRIGAGNTGFLSLVQ